jgi:hypothetical protein
LLREVTGPDPRPKLGALLPAIQEFCRRVPALINFQRNARGDLVGKQCGTAVGDAMLKLCETANNGRCPGPGRCVAYGGPTFVQGIVYQRPLDEKDRQSRHGVGGCCRNISPLEKEYWTFCNDTAKRFGNKTYAEFCAHCNDAQGNARHGEYALLKYDRTQLAQAVDLLRCRIDSGCATHVGVMSGICDDAPDSGCKSAGFRCPEHRILVFARDGDRFLFWDPAQTSAIPGSLAVQGCGFSFGILFYDAALNRFSTSPVAGLEVNGHGFYTASQWFVAGAQKRYQVVTIENGRPFKPASRNC